MLHYARYEVVLALLMKIKLFSGVMTSRLVNSIEALIIVRVHTHTHTHTHKHTHTHTHKITHKHTIFTT